MPSAYFLWQRHLAGDLLCLKPTATVPVTYELIDTFAVGCRHNSVLAQACIAAHTLCGHDLWAKGSGWAVLCCAMLCCAVLCHAVLACASLC